MPTTDNDAPSSALPAPKLLARDWIAGLERGIAVLFTEHSMDVVFAYADRMIVLARGNLIAQGTPPEIRANPLVQEVYLGTGKVFENPQAAL